MLSSLDSPLSRAAWTPRVPSPAVTSRLTIVPTNADVVRIDTPCARYSTANMIAAPPTSATASAGRPVASAGSMNAKKTAPATTRPARARTPFQPATPITTATNARANSPSGISRSITTRAYKLWPGSPTSVTRTPSPTVTPDSAEVPMSSTGTEVPLCGPDASSTVAIWQASWVDTTAPAPSHGVGAAIRPLSIGATDPPSPPSDGSRAGRSPGHSATRPITVANATTTSSPMLAARAALDSGTSGGGP